MGAADDDGSGRSMSGAPGRGPLSFLRLFGAVRESSHRDSNGARGRGPAVTPALSWLFYAIATLTVTALIVATGGAPTSLAHLYYLPILYMAVRYGVTAAVISSVIAGIAVGPWMITSSPATDRQTTSAWLVRLGLFVLVGVVAAVLARSRSRQLNVMVRDVYVAQGLRAAVRQDTIRVHYQPLIDLTEGDVIGFEALCRWHDSKGRAIPPDRFIPEAERTGVIMALGRRVLHRAVDQGHRWADRGRRGLLITVNVSAVQLSEPAFLADLIEVVQADGGDAFQLCLEITETAIIADPVRALATLRQARALGVTVALDDFGTGLSSLAYLAEFPIDIIKIDRSFVAAIGTDPKSHALVRAMVQMAHALGALTIAEGIETADQLKALRALGCAIGQGYYLGFPGDVDEVEWEPREMVPANEDSVDTGAPR